MVSLDFGEVFGYPLEGEDAVVTQLVGGGIPLLVAIASWFVMFLGFLFPLFFLLNLLLLPFQVAISVFWLGFFVVVARHTYEGAAQPPTWDAWREMGREGIYGFAIGLAYQVPGIVLALGSTILFVVLVAGAGMASGSNESGAAAVGLLAFLLVGAAFILTMAYFLVAAYLFPISLCAYAATGDLGAAFSTETLKRMALDGEYAVTWAIVAIVYLGGASMLSATLVGYLVVTLFYFYLGTAAFFAFGRVYGDVVGVESVPPPAAEAE